MAFLLAVLWATSGRAAEPLADLDAVRAHADAGMAWIGKGRVPEGIRHFGGAWPLPPAEIQRLVEQAEQQAPVVASRFGQGLGHEALFEQRVGTSFLRRVYLQRFTRHAITWVVIYYRGEDGWYVNNLNFSDSVDELFEMHAIPFEPIDEPGPG